MAYDLSVWARTRLVIDPSEFPLTEALLTLDLEQFGFLMRLIGYASHAGLPDDITAISRMAGVPSVRATRRLWLVVQKLFELQDGRWRPKVADWWSVYVEPQERRNLSGYYDELVAFWGDNCVYCRQGMKALDIEHITPLSRGGTNSRDNLTLACRRCNLAKGSRTAAEFGHPEVHEKAKGF